MQKQPGYVLMESGEQKPFRAASPKNALKVVIEMKILGINRLTPKELRKAKIKEIYFGRTPRIIFPLKHQRLRSKRKSAQVSNSLRPTLGRDMCRDIGRRQHDIRFLVAA